MNVSTQNPTLTLANQWLKEGKSFDQIHQQLLAKGVSDNDAEELMKHIRDERYEVQRKKGIPLIALGVALCFVGCFATLMLSDNGVGFNVCLYGLTSIGATTIVGGLAFILG